MNTSFASRFKEFCKNVDKVNNIVEQTQEIIESKIKLYNVHKRSLPVGTDKIVIFNVEENEGKEWINTKLKLKEYNNVTSDFKTIVYYDLVPVDANKEERSIYYNPRPVIIDEEVYSNLI